MLIFTVGALSVEIEVELVYQVLYLSIYSSVVLLFPFYLCYIAISIIKGVSKRIKQLKSMGRPSPLIF